MASLCPGDGTTVITLIYNPDVQVKHVVVAVPQTRPKDRAVRHLQERAVARMVVRAVTEWQYSLLSETV